MNFSRFWKFFLSTYQPIMMQEIMQSLSNVDMINLVSIIDKLQCFKTKNFWFNKFWILDHLFMEHPIIVIMPLKVIPYRTGSGIFPTPKVIYTEKLDTQIMRSDLQEYSSFICKYIPNVIYRLVFRAICNAFANFWNENAFGRSTHYHIIKNNVNYKDF